MFSSEQTSWITSSYAESQNHHLALEKYYQDLDLTYSSFERSSYISSQGHHAGSSLRKAEPGSRAGQNQSPKQGSYKSDTSSDLARQIAKFEQELIVQ